MIDGLKMEKRILRYYVLGPDIPLLNESGYTDVCYDSPETNKQTKHHMLSPSYVYITEKFKPYRKFQIVSFSSNILSEVVVVVI